MTDQTFEPTPPPSETHAKGTLVSYVSTDLQSGEETTLYGLVVDTAAATETTSATVSIVPVPSTVLVVLAPDQVAAA